MTHIGQQLSSSFVSAFDLVLQPLLAYCQRNRLFLTLLLAPPVAHCIYVDYTAYLSLGPGGIPHNPIGWLISSFGRALLSRETLSTKIYTAAAAPEAETRNFLHKPLPLRTGARPTLGSHPIPHRQTDQIPSRDVIDAVQSSILEIHADYPNSTELRTSVYEKIGPALFILPSVKSGRPKREIAHVHATEEAGEGSLHVILAPGDCVEVIEKGWGERHPFAGVLGGKLLPAEYLMVYAPREWSEVAVVRGIVEAGVRAALGVEGKTVPGGWN